MTMMVVVTMVMIMVVIVPEATGLLYVPTECRGQLQSLEGGELLDFVQGRLIEWTPNY